MSEKKKDKSKNTRKPKSVSEPDKVKSQNKGNESGNIRKPLGLNEPCQLGKPYLENEP